MNPILKTLIGVPLVLGGLFTAYDLALAHGNVTPQPVDTGTLAKIGATWVDNNPYRGSSDAIRIGHTAFAENCARCHGIEAVSGGIAPDLRHLPLGDDGDGIFQERIRHGSIRNGITYMPPFDGVLSQEAAWAIRAWLESVHVE